MRLRDPKSIIVIFVYLAFNLAILIASLETPKTIAEVAKTVKAVAPEFTEIESLDYFHLRDGVPQMSLAAEKMRSQGDELADFDQPRGVYNFEEKNKTIRYSGNEGTYRKDKNVLNLVGEVELHSEEADYRADRLKYFFKKDLILGSGEVNFKGKDLKTMDEIIITSEKMRAKPGAQFTEFKGRVQGSLQRKKKYEGKLTFSSNMFQMEGDKSLAHLEGDVLMKRENYLITAGKADMYLENFNKSLKYFVLNDDVKVTEKLQTPEGVTERKAFSERLEGFGREQKMVLSGAPRVEMGKDVIKGYRITIRENVDLIEVDDAMSDVQVKRKKLKE
jgi:LPS export ABC transporter protein LptC